MRRYWEIDQTFAQPSESLLKKNLKESVKKQKEKGNKLEPVVISGRAIAKSWWGKAWCDNLERYADFASRLERGKCRAWRSSQASSGTSTLARWLTISTVERQLCDLSRMRA